MEQRTNLNLDSPDSARNSDNVKYFFFIPMLKYIRKDVIHFSYDNNLPRWCDTIIQFDYQIFVSEL